MRPVLWDLQFWVFAAAYQCPDGDCCIFWRMQEVQACLLLPGLLWAHTHVKPIKDLEMVIT